VSTPQDRTKPLLQDPAALTAARTEARLSRTELARLAQISVPHYCQAEKGTRSLSGEYLNRVADALKRPVRGLMNPVYAAAGIPAQEPAGVAEAARTPAAA
jgi:transcriptional regulator with XRE-family HTH domain